MPDTTSDSPRILRYEVPVDDQAHAHYLSGSVLHVAARRPDVVELWALDTGGPKLKRWFRVFGTGQPLPGHAQYHGTVLVADGRLVWHLLEVGDVG